MKRFVAALIEQAIATVENASIASRWRSATPAMRSRAERAVDRGAAWFDDRRDLTMSALFTIERAWAATGDPRLAFIADRIARYRGTLRDPALRLFDPAYDPDDPALAGLPHVMDVRPYHAVELPGVEAANADRLGLGPAFLDRLAAMEDGGGYGTTHIVVCGVILKRYDVIDHGAIDAALARTIAPMLRRNRTRYAGDQFAERVFVLQLMDRSDLVHPAWIHRLVEAQRDDGGWGAIGIPPLNGSNEHTTALALASIARFLHDQAGLGRPAEQPARRS